MNLIFRMIYLFLSTLFKPRLNVPEDTSRVDLMVLLNDLDTNWHMNNGRYLTIMDLGRLDLILRSGLMGMMLKMKAVPILSAATIRYRLPLNPFQSYRLETNIIWWDEKWVYMEQRFIIKKGEKAGAVAAIGLVKGNFFCKKDMRVVPIPTMMDALNKAHIAPPPCPNHVKEWIEAEEALRHVTKRD